MARIRTIKPEFPQSQSMGRVSRDARLLFVLLWTIVDDTGKARGSSRMLASLLFPYDDDAPSLIDGWLGELEAEGCVERYIVDGNDYVRVLNWVSHQKIDRPSKSRLPDPREPSRTIASPRESSSEDRRTKDLDLYQDRSEGGSERARARDPEPKPGDRPPPETQPPDPRAGALREALLDHGVLRRAGRGKLDGLVAAMLADGWEPSDVAEAAADMGGKDEARAGRLAALLLDAERRRAYGDDLARRQSERRALA